MPEAESAFISLAQLLRGPVPVHAPEPEPIEPTGDRNGGGAHAVPAVALPDASVAAAQAQVLRDVRVFRAQLADAFDAARVTLVREFAYAILGRELLLAPADIAAIAHRILAEHPAANPLRLRLAPPDAATLPLAPLSAPVAPLSSRAESRDRYNPDHHALPPIVADATLAPGDVLLELTCGHIDARLGVRIAALLDCIA